jgi:hypothetical protein
MKTLIVAICVFAFACAVSVAAQDSTATTRTKVKADDARTVTMTGCLQSGVTTNSYSLVGNVTASGEDLKSKSTVKTDVDKNKTEVKSKDTTKIDDAVHAPVGTAFTRYELTPKEGLNLAPHVGHRVEITAVMLDPAKDKNDKAKVQIKEKTDIDVEHAPDAKGQSKTKVEVPRGPDARLMALSVRHIAPTCTP